MECHKGFDYCSNDSFHITSDVQARELWGSHYGRFDCPQIVLMLMVVGHIFHASIHFTANIYRKHIVGESFKQDFTTIFCFLKLMSDIYIYCILSNLYLDLTKWSHFKTSQSTNFGLLEVWGNHQLDQLSRGNFQGFWGGTILFGLEGTLGGPSQLVSG